MTISLLLEPLSAQFLSCSIFYFSLERELHHIQLYISSKAPSSLEALHIRRTWSQTLKASGLICWLCVCTTNLAIYTTVSTRTRMPHMYSLATTKRLCKLLYKNKSWPLCHGFCFSFKCKHSTTTITTTTATATTKGLLWLNKPPAPKKLASSVKMNLLH